MLDNFRAVSELLVNSQTKHPLQIVKFCVIPDSSREANSQVISTNTIKAMYFSSYYLFLLWSFCVHIFVHNLISSVCILSDYCVQ